MDSDLFLVAAFVAVASVLFRAWEIMLLIGILHAETGTPVGTISYALSIPVAVLVTGITTNFSTSRSS
jgi:hypothetical protein